MKIDLTLAALINLQKLKTMPAVKVNFSKENVGAIEIVVPKGTPLADLAKIQLAIDNQLVKQLHPRACNACLSGSHIFIREILDGAVNVKY